MRNYALLEKCHISILQYILLNFSISDNPKKMMHLKLFTTMAVLFGVACADQNSTNLYDLTAVDIDGNAISMSQYAGNVSLVVNVATY